MTVEKGLKTRFPGSPVIVVVVLAMAAAMGCGDSGKCRNNCENESVCGDGICDANETHADCPADCDPCMGLPEEGCCDGVTLFWCDEGTLRHEDCGANGCGWSNQEGYGYICGATGEDPSGIHRRSCGCGWEKGRLRAVPRIFYGTPEPELACLTRGQILAIGAVLTDYGDGLENFCTGSVISDDIVLTAAHCLVDYWGHELHPGDLVFTVGDDAMDPIATFSVREIVVHPGFDGVEAHHDIGLLILEEPVYSYVENIQPLPLNKRDFSEELVSRVVQNVGFGVTHDNFFNSLRWWTTEPITRVEKKQFTVFGHGVSAVCHGDSGGPALFSFDTLAPHILGTLSWGDPTCLHYDHFSRMDANYSFLEPFLGGFDSCLGLDAVGRCLGDTAQWCENGELHQRCCPEGCIETGDGFHRCSTEPMLCENLDAQGRCSEAELTWCDNGVVQRKFCNICGWDTCGWVGGSVGFDCIEK